MKNRIVFFGTPQFAADVLQYLLENRVPIVAVVTQPDRPKGRSSTPAPSPVKQVANRLVPDLTLYQPEKAKEEDFLKKLAQLKADLFVVVAYGQILTQNLLDIPPLGSINVHASLLPKFRGAAPIERSILEGEKETGISIMKIVRQLDAGDVIAVDKTPIPPEMTFGELKEKLCKIAKPLLLSVIKDYEKGVPDSTPQDAEKATFAPKIETDECEVHWTDSAEKINNKIRGLSPKPGAWCWISIQGAKKRLKILRSRIVYSNGKAGALLSKDGVVACKDQAVQLLEVQPEGKKPMPAKQWFLGLKESPVFAPLL